MNFYENENRGKVFDKVWKQSGNEEKHDSSYNISAELIIGMGRSAALVMGAGDFPSRGRRSACGGSYFTIEEVGTMFVITIGLFV